MHPVDETETMIPRLCLILALSLLGCATKDPSSDDDWGEENSGWDGSTEEPWDADLTGDVMLSIGGENAGISEELLAASDEAIRIPMAGFTPSYNLQAPMAVVAVEALRQRRS